MLNALKSIVVLALIAFGVTYVFASSLDFQHCVYEYGKTNTDAKYFKEGVPIFVRFIPIYRHCIGDYVTSKHDVITAVFTIVIAVFTTVLAIFTVSLARSTRIAANAAADGAQSDAAIRRPRLIVSGTYTTQNEREFAIGYGIENFGETPAILLQTSIQARLYGALPSAPEYDAPRIWRDRVIYGNSGIPVADGLRCSTPASDGNVTLVNLEEGSKHLFFFGYFVFRDVFEITRKAGFCFQINTFHGGQTRMGGKVYNYEENVEE